jgi:hypothetical protein
VLLFPQISIEIDRSSTVAESIWLTSSRETEFSHAVRFSGNHLQHI